LSFIKRENDIMALTSNLIGPIMATLNISAIRWRNSNDYSCNFLSSSSSLRNGA